VVIFSWLFSVPFSTLTLLGSRKGFQHVKDMLVYQLVSLLYAKVQSVMA